MNHILPSFRAQPNALPVPVTREQPSQPSPGRPLTIGVLLVALKRAASQKLRHSPIHMSAALVQLGTLQDASRAELLLLRCSNSQKLELLDCVFKANLYRPQDVVTHGLDLLKRGYLGNAKYRIQEQTCIACIDVGLWAQAGDLINSLKQSFPKSLRVKRLEGLLLEAQPSSGVQRYSRARALYDEILKADEANLLTHKRKIAM
jgi:hypothetical protein